MDAVCFDGGASSDFVDRALERKQSAQTPARALLTDKEPSLKLLGKK